MSNSIVRTITTYFLCIVGAYISHALVMFSLNFIYIENIVNRFELNTVEFILIRPLYTAHLIFVLILLYRLYRRKQNS